MKKIITLITIALVSFTSAKQEGRKNVPVQVLEKFDTNRDGALDKSERRSMREARQDRIQKARQFRQSFNLDGDRRLNDQEFSAFKAAREQKILARFDENQNGILDIKEQDALKKAKARHQKIIARKGKSSRKDYTRD